MPERDRLAYSVIMEFTPAGERVAARVHKSVIRSVHRNTYRIVQDLLDGRDTEETRKIRFLERPLKLFEKLKFPFEVCRTRINITSHMIELGQVESAKKMLRRALEEAEIAGYDRQRALALSNLGLIAYRAEDYDATESYCIRSNSVARPREFLEVVFRNCYYLWQISRKRKDTAATRTHERALKGYLGRIEQPIDESESFRAYLAGGK